MFVDVSERHTISLKGNKMINKLDSASLNLSKPLDIKHLEKVLRQLTEKLNEVIESLNNQNDAS